MSIPSSEVQTRICPVCRTGHDLPMCPPRSEETSEPIGTEGSVFRVWRVANGEITLLGRVRALNAICAKSMANVLWFVPIANLMVAP